MTVDINGTDLVAAVAIPCLACLVYLGHNGAVVSLMSVIVGAYFVHKAETKAKEEPKEEA